VRLWLTESRAAWYGCGLQLLMKKIKPHGFLRLRAAYCGCGLKWLRLKKT
jgi:hypothetical protein